MIHIAGPLIEGQQRCTRCNWLLTDYANTMVLASDPPLWGFAEGAHIDVEPGVSVVTKEPADCRNPRTFQ